MARYEYGRIARLADSLAQAGIDEAVSADILRGGESIRTGTPSAKKAEWMRCAMLRMDALLEPEIRHCVREACACCLGGKRLECSTAIARGHQTLEGRISAANQTRFVFGHSVTMREDGRVLACGLLRKDWRSTGAYACRRRRSRFLRPTAIAVAGT